MGNTAILDGEAIRQSVYRRLDGGRSFAGREAYFGASEEGRCSRRVVFDKVQAVPDSERFSAPSAHKVNLGRVLENEAVQILRLTGELELRETGQNQVEVVHPSLPYFRCHPDGRILAGDMVIFDDAVITSEGDGVLEAKSTAPYLIKKWIKDGLGIDYRSQANDQMGLRGLKWCLFVATCREGVKDDAGEWSPFKTWILRFDPELWASSEARVQVMEASRLAIEDSKQAAAEAGGEFTREDMDALLPEGEPERGYCASCPLAPTCHAYLNAAPDCPADHDLPDSARLELEVILEELADVEADWKPLDKRIKELKEQAKPLVPTNLARKFVLDGGEAAVILKSVADFSAERLLAAVQESLSTYAEAIPAAVRDYLTLSILKAFQAESARKKVQAQINLKPRRSA